MCLSGNVRINVDKECTEISRMENFQYPWFSGEGVKNNTARQYCSKNNTHNSENVQTKSIKVRSNKKYSLKFLFLIMSYSFTNLDGVHF